MFGIDGPEFLVILLVLIVVVGPKDLPKMLKTMARAIAYVRSTANEFRYQFDDAMRQVEFDDLQKTLSDNSDLNLNKELTRIFNPIHDIVRGIGDNSDVKTLHHKTEKDKEILVCDQNGVNEDLTVSDNPHSSGSISLISKDREGAS
ncbi:twin-arginine translocase subunit TatB [Bartonella alsatica]|uniref:Twin arginine-targeting protein translocase TatB n=2 Tax=Bartonella alsatica TaxID=52764 RepID=J0PRP1_9HYPH|nr:Sec-independent protein translocase protein TatB [Bartonella alsatica]EJF75171.1 twin arginine-targeting protein translocase TatB [Bartonella alsatica IBS 382]QLC52442.1 twin-arginine translocase subunit TatB [Bartonella alsatica]